MKVQVPSLIHPFIFVMSSKYFMVFSRVFLILRVTASLRIDILGEI